MHDGVSQHGLCTRYKRVRINVTRGVRVGNVNAVATPCPGRNISIHEKRRGLNEGNKNIYKCTVHRQKKFKLKRERADRLIHIRRIRINEPDGIYMCKTVLFVVLLFSSRNTEYPRAN